jgi:hypothetical protein
MGWMYCGTDVYGREIGYGIEATCDQRGCEERIDRGLGCVCGTMHNGDHNNGCDRYYCDKHGGGSAYGRIGKHAPYPEGGRCPHRGRFAWGRTYCQLMWSEPLGEELFRRYFCACHGWKAIGGSPRTSKVKHGFRHHIKETGGIGPSFRHLSFSERGRAA